MRAVRVASRTSALLLPADLNNLLGYCFGTRIAYTSAKRIAGWSIRLLGGVMSKILSFARTWARWYGVLRYAKSFSFANSVRYGLWLTRS
jgi:hypothetical protein